MIDHANEAEDLLTQLGKMLVDAPTSVVAKAQVHATLAVAQRLDSLLALLERGR